MQEAKISYERLTKEMCMVEGFQSFWACSRGKKGYSGVTTYASKKWAPMRCDMDFLIPICPGEERREFHEAKAAEKSDHLNAPEITHDAESQQLTDSKRRFKTRNVHGNDTEGQRCELATPLSVPSDRMVASTSHQSQIKINKLEMRVDSDEAAWQREGRVLLTDHDRFVLINVYAPNAGERPERPRLRSKLAFLGALQRFCEELIETGREVILVGDFNVSADERDVHPKIGLNATYSEAEQNALRFFFEHPRLRMVDAWRKLHPNSTGVYTVWNEKTSARAFNEGLRIDYVLMTPGIAENVTSCEVLGTDVLPAKWSDHAGIILELEEMPPPQEHPPCQEWRSLEHRFVDPSQPSIAAFFSRETKKRSRQSDAEEVHSKKQNVTTGA